jgi:L-ribulose-5-phosphate 3-epimerase
MSVEHSPAKPRRQRRTGVCSWSLRADSLDDLVEKVRATGVDCIQLALDPAGFSEASVTHTASALERAGIEIRSGMLSMEGEDYATIDSIRRTGGVRSDALWPANFARARAAANLAQTLSLPLVTLHAGFLPEDERDPERAKLIGRLRDIVSLFADAGVRIGFETGQESAATLLAVLDELNGGDDFGVGANFDPANMILYGTGDPVDALEKLASHVVQVHVKDARPARTRGAWGEEVPVGAGAVDWKRFFDVLNASGADVDLLIERESGDQRVADVRSAREFLQRLAPAGSRHS